MNPDMSKVEAFAGQVVTDIAAAFSGVMTNIGLALGAQAGEARLSEVLREAGFSNMRRATETPFNLIIEARK